MNLINKIKISFSCNKIGVDEFGNQYFEAKKPTKSDSQKKRYVIYNGIVEPSKIPAEWHYWLHYTSNSAPVNINTNKYPWQKIHLPNLSGTKYAYFPSGAKFKNSTRNKVSSDYQAWNPDQINQNS